MVSIKLKFRESQSENGCGVLYYQLLQCGRKREIATGRKILKSEWDKVRSVLLINEAPPQRRSFLRGLYAKCNDEMAYIRQLMQITGGLDMDHVIARFKEYRERKNLRIFMESESRQLIANGRYRTASVYKIAVDSFTKYLSGEDIRIADIDNIKIRGYEEWLHDNNISQNTSSCYLRALRAIYNKAADVGLTEQNYPFRGAYTGVAKTVKRAVAVDIIVNVKGLDLSDSPRLAMARDMFLLSFYLRGMPFVDLASLKNGDMQDGYISYVRHKTGQQLTVKVENAAKHIIKRYEKYSYEDNLLPLLSPYIKYDSALRNYNLRLKKISASLGLSKPLTSYVPRHSWASMAKKSGIPLQIISESLGHDNENTTRIYLSSFDQDVLDAANAKIMRKLR